MRWTPWADSYDPAAARWFLELAGERWRSLRGFDYAIADGTGRILGGAALRPHLAAGGMGIGYWVRAGATRRHVATRAAALLTAEAFTLDGVTHTEIRHDRANVISGRIPRRLGYTCTGTAPRERLAPGHSGIELRWRMSADRYAASMASTLAAG